ncbi:3-hydroxyacyl-CoA dehydrogenase NAD-binding domain-containing protein [Sorangium sp. So ce134]
MQDVSVLGLGAMGATIAQLFLDRGHRVAVAGIAPGFGQFLQHEGAVIQSGDYTASESPLRISVEATRRLLDTATEANINTEFPLYAARQLERADAAGLGGEELAAVMKVLRQSGASRPVPAG